MEGGKAGGAGEGVGLHVTPPRPCQYGYITVAASGPQSSRNKYDYITHSTPTMEESTLRLSVPKMGRINLGA